MANEIRLKFDSPAALTISLASLANGSGRQSTLITGNTRPGAIIDVKIRTGASAPTDNSVVDVYLIRGDGTNRDDGAGASDAAWTARNAQLLGSLTVGTGTATDYRATFDTGLVGALGGEWGIGIVNRTGQALDATGGNHVVSYRAYVPEVQ